MFNGHRDSRRPQGQKTIQSRNDNLQTFRRKVNINFKTFDANDRQKIWAKTSQRIKIHQPKAVDHIQQETERRGKNKRTTMMEAQK